MRGATALVAAAAVAVRVIVALLPIRFLLNYIVPDDTFYYLTIGRQIVAGHGVTFDQVAVTNGFHPLWMTIVVPVAAITDDPLLGFRLLLAAAACIDVAAVLVLVRLLGRLEVAPRIALWTGLLYAIAPTVLTQAGGMSGLETPLVILLALLLIERLLVSPRRGSDVRWGVVTGLLAGLLMLARTDMVVCVAVVLAISAFAPELRRDWRSVGTAIATASLIVLPWLVWSHLTTGSIVQVSGVSIASFARDVLGAETFSFERWVVTMLLNALQGVRYAPIAFLTAAPPWWTILLGVFGLVSLGLLVTGVRGQWRAGVRPWLVASILPTVWFLLVILHTLRMVNLRSWYHALLLPSMAILLAIAVDRGERSRGVPVERIGIRPKVALFIFLVSIIGAIEGRLSQSGRDAFRYDAALALPRHVPGGATIGAWNAGVLAWFAPAYRVVNLDGVVSNAAWGAIQQRSLARYADRIGVDWLLDDRSTLDVWAPYWRPGMPRSIGTEGDVIAARPIIGTRDRLLLIRLHERPIFAPPSESVPPARSRKQM